jgi:hypothetical protein
MTSESSDGSERIRNLRRAVNDGVLRDVSHVATRIGLLCPTFVTVAFWESVEISCSEERLVGVLDACCPVHDFVCDGKFGSLFFGVDGGPACPWGVHVNAIVEPFEGIGTVVVLGDCDEELDFRVPRTQAGGGFFTV